MGGSSRSQSQFTTSNANSQSNIWDTPEMQNFLAGYSNTYGNDSINSVHAPALPEQFGALANQSAVSPFLTGQVAPTVTNIAQQGVNTGDINKFMSPFVQSVVDPTLESFNKINQQALVNNQGNAAMKGALGNSANVLNANNMYYQSVLPQQQAAVAGLFNQGYGQALGAAFQNAGTQLNAANSAGNLATVESAANKGQFDMGEAIRNANLQNSMIPFQLYNQGVEGLKGLGALSGQNVQSTESMTGRSTGSPSLASSIFGGIGLGLQALPALASLRDGGVADLPRYDAGGSVSGLPPFDGIGGSWDNGYDDGGAVPTWAATVAPATTGPDWGKLGKGVSGFGQYLDKQQPDLDKSILQKSRASETAMRMLQMPQYAGGGDVGPVGLPGHNHNHFVDKVLSAVDALSGAMRKNGGAAGTPGMGPGVGDQGFKDGGRPGYADGDIVLGPTDNVLADRDVPDLPAPEARPPPPPPKSAAALPERAPPAAPARKPLSIFGYELPGDWQLRPDGTPMPPTAVQRFGQALMQYGANDPIYPNPLAPVGKALTEQRQSAAANELDASKLTGNYRGAASLAAQGLPSEIAAREATANLANTQADKKFLLEIEKQKIVASKEAAVAAAIAERQQSWQLMQDIMRQQREAAGEQGGSNQRRKWVPVPEAPAAPEASVDPNAGSPLAPPTQGPAQAAPPAAAPATPPPRGAPAINPDAQVPKGTNPRASLARDLGGTPDAPFPNKGMASWGQYYLDGMGNVWRRASFWGPSQDVLVRRATRPGG